MRIGFITGEYPPMEGGVGAFTRELARGLVKKGHEVGIFTRKAAVNSSEDGIDVYASVGKLWGWQANWLAFGWMKQFLPDIVNIQFETAAFDMHPAIHFLPAAASPIPIITTFHDLKTPYLFPKAGGLRLRLLKKLAYTSAGIINTDKGDEQVTRDIWHVQNGRWIPIGSNITVHSFSQTKREQFRNKIGASDEDLVLSYFGFLNASKGALQLIDAVGKLRTMGVKVRLLMIGGRAGASDLTNYAYGLDVDKRIQANNIKGLVHWTGFCDEADVSRYFYASDLCILPYTDGVSLRRGTLMAAMAHGMPIITTEPQIKTSELEGVLATVPVGDADVLAKKILEVSLNEKLRTHLKERSLAAANQFGWEGIAEETLTFYRAILS